MKSRLAVLLTVALLASACGKQETESPDRQETLRFQDKVYTYEGTRQARNDGFIITEYKQVYSRIYFVKPVQKMNMYLFSEKYKKTFEDLGFEVYSLGDEHIGYDDHSIIYIVPARSGDKLVVLLAVKTAEYEEKHEQAGDFLNALKALTPLDDSST